MQTTIRKAIPCDVKQIADLYCQTIKTVNNNDYNALQVAAWISRGADYQRWLSKIEDQYFIVAESQNTMSGFASITTHGYLDLLFVSNTCQGKGVASCLLKELEAHAITTGLKKINADVSITAKPFFDKRNFVVLKMQTVYIGNVGLTNFSMIKQIDRSLK